MTKAYKKTGLLSFILLIIILLAVSHFYYGSSITQIPNIINTTVSREKVPLLSGFPEGPESDTRATSDLSKLLLAGIVA